MDAAAAAIRVIVPIYLLITAGYLLKKTGLFSRNTLKEMNQSVFRLFLPMLLFENMYQSDVRITDAGLIVYAAGCVFIIYAFCNVLISRIEKNRARAATVIQGMYRSNFALLGIALTETMYGSGGTQVTGMLVAVIVPLYNVLAVILFERFCGNRNSGITDILPGILRNPLIIGTLLGFLAGVSGIAIPDAVNSAAVSSYSMACAMGGDEDLAGEIVLLTTVLSVFSIGTGIFVLKTMQLI